MTRCRRRKLKGPSKLTRDGKCGHRLVMNELNGDLDDGRDVAQMDVGVGVGENLLERGSRDSWWRGV